MRKFIRKYGRLSLVSSTAVTLAFGPIVMTQAQELEEVIVTAQRREQSLQDVPISIQTFQGSDIARQGFHTLNELTVYAPGLVIKDQSEEQGLLLRSAGTQSKNMAVESGVPIFVDGIHMGRGSQLKGGLMDIGGVEVLKGPQPVYFGQNASAGALIMTSRRPGDEWEANLSGEYGNFGMKIVEGAFGGPVTDTLGVRVAAKYYYLEGFMRDWFTGDKFPQRETKTVRGIVEWNPSERFQATLKGEIQYNDLGPQVNPIILDRFSATPKLTHPERTVLLGISSLNIPGVKQEIGEYTQVGYKYGPTYVNPRLEAQASGIPLTEASTNAVGTVFDLTTCQKAGGMLVDPGGIPSMQPEKGDSCNLTDESESWPANGMLDLVYTFDNGIEINSLTGYSEQEFYNTPGNSGGGAFNNNVRSRGEDYNQWSTEFRVSSATGGQIEWMTGAYYQINDMDYWSDRYRLDGQRPLLAVRASDDSEWKSMFATATYNFWENKASIDVGGRYTDVHKEGKGFNSAAEYYVRNEISAGGDGTVIRVPFGIDVRAAGARGTASRAFLTANPGIVNGSIVGRSEFTLNCSSLRASTIAGLTPPASSCVQVANTIDEDSFDPQVVLRYRPNDDMSFYAKYATAFKAGGFDLAVSELPAISDDFTFGPENYEIYEVGGRGSFMDGRLSTEATVYYMDMSGIQVTFVSRELDRSITNNVGKQDVKGVELSARYAATDRLTLSGYISVMKGQIVEFNDSVCTPDETVAGVCRDAAASLAEVGDLSLVGTINRSNVEARNAPDWQFSTNARYELPTLLEGYYSNLDVFFMASDDILTNRDFSRKVSMKRFADMNLSMEIGGTDERWSVTVYGRNLLAPKPTYFPEFDLDGEGILSGSDVEIGLNNFTTYGLRFNYKFF